MITTRQRIDPWRTAELSGNNDQRRIQHATLFKIIEQGRQGLIEGRHKQFPQTHRVFAVRVPVTIFDTDKAAIRFDQTAGHEQTLPHAGHTVRGPHALFLPLNIEGFFGFAVVIKSPSLLMKVSSGRT